LFGKSRKVPEMTLTKDRYYVVIAKLERVAAVELYLNEQQMVEQAL